MSAVVLSGGVIAGCYRYLSTTVVAKLDLAEKSQVRDQRGMRAGKGQFSVTGRLGGRLGRGACRL
jgi:hypothetical protein